ncbi:MAG TPA: hypothetical protein VGT79_00445 [Xanthomonadaceae bacterium]|nr:hypothetical protein [Xanthomonadaceae bacterium]
MGKTLSEVEKVFFALELFAIAIPFTPLWLFITVSSLGSHWIPVYGIAGLILLSSSLLFFWYMSLTVIFKDDASIRALAAWQRLTAFGGFLAGMSIVFVAFQPMFKNAQELAAAFVGLMFLSISLIIPYGHLYLITSRKIS